MATVTVIDYGMGNIRSVSKALEYVGGDARIVISHQAEEILQADRVVFPGVGALKDCMAELQRLALDDVLLECAKTKPILGICLGIQALMDYSEENEGTKGLGIIPGQSLHFANDLNKLNSSTRFKIPHMGWNQVTQLKQHKLWDQIPQQSRFYFDHSYYVKPDASEPTAATTDYGIEYVSAIARDNIFAVQFHPEKSQQVGLRLLANFMEWDGEE